MGGPRAEVCAGASPEAPHSVTRRRQEVVNVREAPSRPPVTKVIGDLPPAHAKVARRLRQLVRRSAPELREVLKWQNPVWVGRRNVACLMFYPDHVNLGFFRGAELVARFPLIEGMGKGLRHVKVWDLKAASNPELSRIVREAVQLDAGG